MSGSRRNPLWLVHRAFGRAYPVVAWAEFLVGLAGVIGTAAGWLPPYTHGLWARVSTCVLWAVLADQGYTALAEIARDSRP